MKIEKFLKTFGLSFFWDRTAKEGVQGGLFTAIVCFLLSLVLLFCGALAAMYLPFKSIYNRSDDFKAALYNAFANPDSSKRIVLRAQGGKISAELDGQPAYIDSKLNDPEYTVNGYIVVVDTRPAEAYDDFTAYCVNGEGAEINYEQFLSLSKDEQSGYEFKLRYSPNELTLSPELTAAHEKYLTDSKNADFAELQKNKQDLSKADYAKKVYELYIKAYYPDLSKYETNGGPPLLRNYYLQYILDGANKFFFVFNDLCTATFFTNGGMERSFYGFYDELATGYVCSAQQSESFARNAVDEFIYSLHSASSPVIVQDCFFGSMSLVPVVAIALVLFAVLLYFIFRKANRDWCYGFGACLKLLCGYSHYAALFSALITLICGFFMPKKLLLMLEVLVFAAVLSLRAIIFIVMEFMRIKRTAGEPEFTVPTQIFDLTQIEDTSETPDTTEATEGSEETEATDGSENSGETVEVFDSPNTADQD